MRSKPWSFILGIMIPLILVVVVIAIVAGLIYSHKIRSAFHEWVSRRGFTIDPTRDYGIDTQYPHLKCLHQGKDRYGYDFVTGSWRDRQLKTFHYHYETETRDSKGNRHTHNHYLTVISLLSEVPLKNLDIRPEGLLDKFGTFFGFEDINFESAEFSRKYHVSSDDRKWAYDILHARCIEHLLERPPIHMHMHGTEAIAWFQGKYKPVAIEEAAETLAGVLDCLPRYILDEQSQLTTSEIQS